MINVPLFFKEDSQVIDIQKILEYLIKDLNTTHEISLNEIITNFLQVSSSLISTDKIGLNVAKLLTNEDEDEDEDEEYYSLYEAKESVKFMKEQTKRIKRAIKNQDITTWEIKNLREQIESSLEIFAEKRYDKLILQVEEIQREAYPILDEAEVACAVIEINKISSRVIHNITSVNSIVSDIDRILLILETKEALTNNIKQLAKEVKEKCASYRAKKKMLDAEVAQNCGNLKKAEKLKAEAHALIIQDWRLIMKKEDYPDLMSL